MSEKKPNLAIWQLVKRLSLPESRARQHSLHTRLVSRFGAGLLLVVSLLIVLAVLALHQSNVRLFHQERERSLVTFAEAITPLVARFDLADIDSMLEEARSGYHLERVELFDYYGQQYNATANQPVEREADHIYPLRDHVDSGRVGEMRLWWGDNPAHRAALYRSLSVALLVTTLVVLLIACVLRGALLLYVVEPVEALQQFVMTGAGHGGQFVRPPDFRVHELNTLARVVVQAWQQAQAESFAKQQALMRHRDELLHRANLTDALGRALSMADMSVCFRLSHATKVELVGRPVPTWLQSLQLNAQLSAEQLKHVVQYSLKGDARVNVNMSRQTSSQSFSLEVNTDDEGTWSLTSVSLEAGGWALIIVNMTEQYATQRALQHVKKMESLGVMTSGVAHDFNNILAVILNAVELEQLSGRGTRALNTVAKAAERGEKLVRQLLDASRKKVPKIRVVNYDSLLKNLAAVMQATLGSRYRLSLVDKARCQVMAEEDLLETTLLNLIINARDASVEGGLIELVAEPVSEAERASANLNSAIDYVAFRVIDYGTGMNAEVKERIFDPFFTTKPKGHGTGLGLAMAYAFALRSGGRILVESTEGVGSCFSLLLPKVGSSAQPVSQPDRLVEHHDEQAELSMRVLVVDDEASLLNTLVRYLESLGMRVCAASGVTEARLRLAESSLPFDMVITDMLMPDGTGADVIAELESLEQRPFTVLISGNFSADGFLLSDMGRVDVFLEKPFHLSKLRSLIAELSATKAEQEPKTLTGPSSKD